MKKLLFFSVLLCLVVTATLSAQTLRNDYKKIDYLKIEDDQYNLLVEDLKSTYQEIVDSGDLKAWALYHVEYPGGEKSSYHFVSIVTASDLNSIENIFSSIDVPGFIPAGTKSKLANNLDEAVSVVKSELWKVENRIPGDTADKPSHFMTMDYMNVTPGRDPDYLMLEDEVAKPIHRERMNVDRMAGWEVYSMISPGGTKYGYNYATGNFFDKLEHIEFGFTNEVINQAMGEDTNISELFDTIYNTRELVKIELWKLAAYTE